MSDQCERLRSMVLCIFNHCRAKSAQSDCILLNLYVTFNNLLAALCKSEYKKYKYVHDIPTGAYKTIQMVFCTMKDSCGKEYMKQLKAHLS